MLKNHGAVSNGAIHNKCGPEWPAWKIPRRRGVGRRAIYPRRHGGGRREKESDREIFSNPVYFVLNFAKKAIFIVFYLARRKRTGRDWYPKPTHKQKAS
jgi:hypothetical protein